MKSKADWMPHTWKGEALQLRCFSGVLWLLKDSVQRAVPAVTGWGGASAGLRKAREGKGMIQLWNASGILCWNILGKSKIRARSRQHPWVTTALAVWVPGGLRGLQGFLSARIGKCHMPDNFFFPQVLVCILVSTKSYLLIILHKVTCSNSLV